MTCRMVGPEMPAARHLHLFCKLGFPDDPSHKADVLCVSEPDHAHGTLPTGQHRMLLGQGWLHRSHPLHSVSSSHTTPPCISEVLPRCHIKSTMQIRRIPFWK
eukprot:364507-Chlamydomonas_euryale.AAC.10